MTSFHPLKQLATRDQLKYKEQGSFRVLLIKLQYILEENTVTHLNQFENFMEFHDVRMLSQLHHTTHFATYMSSTTQPLEVFRCDNRQEVITYISLYTTTIPFFLRFRRYVFIAKWCPSPYFNTFRKRKFTQLTALRILICRKKLARILYNKPPNIIRRKRRTATTLIRRQWKS